MQLDSNQISQILPHRYPFALVDRITDGEEGSWARGIKCVSVQEPVFQGHFPTYHVLPGVMIIEALAQVAAVAMLAEPEHRGKIGFLGAVKNARFKRQVRPGDVMEMESRIVRTRGNFAFVEGDVRGFWRAREKVHSGVYQIQTAFLSGDLCALPKSRGESYHGGELCDGGDLCAGKPHGATVCRVHGHFLVECGVQDGKPGAQRISNQGAFKDRRSRVSSGPHPKVPGLLQRERRLRTYRYGAHQEAFFCRGRDKDRRGSERDERGTYVRGSAVAVCFH